jgi:2-polyprenyl-6-methoxyphenol hydroxylase-like FAD-dependent oxidoreductase
MRRAAIIGGSMGGLFAALLLRRQGWRVDVYERIGTQLAGRGAGIVTHDELFAVLREAGIDAAPASLGVSTPGRRIFGRDGAIIGERLLPQYLTSWARLYALLRQALPAAQYHHGKALAEIEEGGSTVTARFTDGTAEEAELLVGADGLFSTVRNQFLPEAQPRYAGYVAWRGLVEEAVLSDETRRTLCDWFSFSLPPGEQMLSYPVAGADEAAEVGRRRINLVWYRPAAADGVLRDLLTDTDGVRHELSIPPNRIRPVVMAQMRADAERLLAPQFAEAMCLAPQPFLQSILDLETPRMRLGESGRIALLGDAAFVARPHVGMGVTKAATDAAALAQALSGAAEVPEALAVFEASRLPYGAAVIRRARALGAYMQAQQLTEAERAAAERHRSPEAVMAETAVATGIAA